MANSRAFSPKQLQQLDTIVRQAVQDVAGKQGILLEDLEHRFTGLAEIVDENLNVRSQPI